MNTLLSTIPINHMDSFGSDMGKITDLKIYLNGALDSSTTTAEPKAAMQIQQYVLVVILLVVVIFRMTVS